MGFNYIEFLKAYNVSKAKAGTLILTVTILTLITLSRNLVYIPVLYILYQFIHMGKPFELLIARLYNYTDCFQPFVLAAFIHLIIAFFANATAPDENDINDKGTETTNTLNEKQLFTSVDGSIT